MTPAGQDDVYLCKNGHAFTHSVRLKIDDTDDAHFTGATDLPGPSLCTFLHPFGGCAERRPVAEQLCRQGFRRGRRDTVGRPHDD